jgi:hypothetical protein
MSNLMETSGANFTIAFYHVPIVPACHNLNVDKDEEHFRHVWKSIFYQNHLSLAFENHEHVYKVGKRIGLD